MLCSTKTSPFPPCWRVRLGLIDRLVDPTESSFSEDVAGADVHWFEVPEWRSAFPGGKVDERHLRRHTLILGETGSGKTRSAILPALAAAYRSPRVGVGLIIDPKRELGGFLQEWSADRTGTFRKRLVRITGDRTFIDIMSGEKWSIEELLRDNRYWSAARRILQRVSTLTHANPAVILLGQPPPTRVDPYWPQEATVFATAVVAVALEFLTRTEEFIKVRQP